MKTLVENRELDHLSHVNPSSASNCLKDFVVHIRYLDTQLEATKLFVKVTWTVLSSKKLGQVFCTGLVFQSCFGGLRDNMG